MAVRYPLQFSRSYPRRQPVDLIAVFMWLKAGIACPAAIAGGSVYDKFVPNAPNCGELKPAGFPNFTAHSFKSVLAL
jgi:hypothetical protein